MSGQGMVMLVLGILACFMGYSMFRTMMPLWGFLLGGWIAFTLLPAVMPDRAGEVLYQVGAFVAGGLVGSLISLPLYFVIIFLSGAALGMLVGIITGALIDVGGITSVRQLTTFTSMSFPPVPQTPLQYLLMLAFGLVLGGAAIGFQKFMITASSAFLGAAGIMTGLVGPINQIATTAAARGAYIMLGWLMLGMIGMFVQFRTMGEV